MWGKWWCWGTQLPCPLTKIKEGLNSSYWPKQFWETCRVHFRTFSNTIEQITENHCTRTKGRQLHVLPASSHSPTWHCSAPERNFPARKSASYQKKKSRVSHQLVQSLRALCEGPPFSFTPLRLAKLGYIELIRNKEEKQNQLLADMQWEHLWFTETCSADRLSRFCHWRSQWSAQPPQMPCRSH